MKKCKQSKAWQTMGLCTVFVLSAVLTTPTLAQEKQNLVPASVALLSVQLMKPQANQETVIFSRLSVEVCVAETLQQSCPPIRQSWHTKITQGITADIAEHASQQCVGLKKPMYCFVATVKTLHCYPIQLIVTVDSRNVIKETNERDNVRVFKMNWPHAAGCPAG